MINFKKFWKGLNVKPKASSESDELGDIETLSSDNKVRFHNGTSNSPLVTEAHSATLTNKSIDSDNNTLSNIKNADIKSSAAIARSKLASGNANRVVVNDASGVQSDAAAITASRALVSDSNGIPTHSSVTSTELGYVSGVTSAIQTQLNSKMTNALTDSNIFVGDATNVAVGVAVSGDVTITNTGNIQIASGVIVNADVNTSAAIARSKLASGTASHVVINDGSGVMSSEAQLASTRGGTGVNNSGTLTYGSNNISLTTSGSTSLTLPTSGTVATLSGTEVLTNKDIDGGTASNSKRITLPKDTKTNLDALTRKEGTIVYGTDTTTVYVDTGSSLVSVSTAGSGPRSEVYVSGGANGTGSSNTRIRRFATTHINTGTAITFTQSSTNGDSFTINETGIYAIACSDAPSGSSMYFGVSLNSSQLSTDITGITDSTILCIAGASSAITSNAATTLKLNSGDVVRMHVDGGYGSATTYTRFRITKVNV